MPLANACCNTLINPILVTCFNYGKDSYFTIFCPEPKDTDDIKEIEEEEEIFNKLKKEEP